MKWYQQFKNKRRKYGISQNRLSLECGVSREYIIKIESGQKEPSTKMKEKLIKALETLNPNATLEMLFDYVRIRFPTLDVKCVVEIILKLRFDQMIHEDYAFYSYSEQYYFGDMVVMTSPDEEKGILLEFKGKGCRQFESFLLAQQRSWYDFFRLVLKENGVFKRLDIAINDKADMLDIAELTTKCQNEECVSVFRSFKSYRSGELVNSKEQDKMGMGNTLYIGSLRSSVYFCIYQKDYEQYFKNGIEVQDTEIKNRFEIRLKDERAQLAVIDLLSYEDAERTAFGIINRYIRFCDKETGIRRSQWKLNKNWEHFIGKDREAIRLTTQPEPFTIEKTLRWLHHQVAPTLKMMIQLDRVKDTNYIGNMLENAKLQDKHIKIMTQQILETEDIIIPEDSNELE